MSNNHTQAMTTNGASMPRTVNRPREITYAEDVLQVTAIWRDLDNVTDQLTNLLHRKSVKLMEISQQEEKAASRERDIVLEVIQPVELDSDVAAPKSVAARERLIKDTLLGDDAYQEMQSGLRILKAGLEQVEVDVRAIEMLHRTLIARLNSVSEYMSFLTSARNARTVAESALPY